MNEALPTSKLVLHQRKETERVEQKERGPGVMKERSSICKISRGSQRKP